MPSTAKKKMGCASKPRLEPILGGTSALVSGTLTIKTPTNEIDIRMQKSGKVPRQPMLLNKARAATAVTRYVEDVLPMPLMPCAKAKLRPYQPSALTSRMIGLPETCRNVVPIPSRKMQPNSNGKVGACSDGIRQAIAFRPRPSNKSFFLPILAASTPPGTLKTAKAKKTKNGINVEMTLLRLYALPTASDIGPMASATPITKKVRNMGSVRIVQLVMRDSLGVKGGTNLNRKVVQCGVRERHFLVSRRFRAN